MIIIDKKIDLSEYVSYLISALYMHVIKVFCYISVYTRSIIDTDSILHYRHGQYTACMHTSNPQFGIRPNMLI
jgi:hypothetical protein